MNTAFDDADFVGAQFIAPCMSDNRREERDKSRPYKLKQ